MSLGKLFLSAVIAEGSVADLLEFGNIDHLFKPNEYEAYEFVRDFVKKYHSLPSPDTVYNHTEQELNFSKEPAKYYYDILVLRHIELHLKRTMKATTELLTVDNKEPEKAMRVLLDGAIELLQKSNSKIVTDFRDAYDVIIADYVSKFNEDDSYGLQFGWPYLDDMLGGLLKGDVASLSGRPAAGKTWFMLHACMYGWLKAGAKKSDGQNHSRMFVSMEMSDLAIKQRITAMQSSNPIWNLKNAQLSTPQLKSIKEGLVEVKSFAYPFYIVDGNLTATVEDIWSLTKQLNPGAIFIDGAYLLKNPKERDRYKRVAENAELIKSELAPLAPVVASWQFAKTASKKKKEEKVTMDDIGYTDVIAQTSTLALGLLQDESVETMSKRKIDILKGRNGEVGSFETYWEFDKMNFRQVEEVDVGDLQYI